MSLSSIDLFGKGICRPHNNLERRRLREDVFRRRIPVFFEFIGYKSDVHSEAVHKAQSPHHAGDERVAIVGFHGEILRPGLAVEVAGVVELKTVSILRGAKDKYILALGHYFLEAVTNLLFALYWFVRLADIGSLNNQYINIPGNVELVNHFAQTVAQISMFAKITCMDDRFPVTLNLQ